MTLIVDANIIGKLFLDEVDSDSTKDFIIAITRRQQKLFAPSFLAFEVYAIGIHHGLNVALPRETLAKLTDSILTLIEPDSTVWSRAYQMAQTGNIKSGYPTLQDSLYHALAIEAGGTFVTADKKHIAKTKEFGHIADLADWERLIDA